MSLKEQVWTLCQEIPSGRVTTYQELASALGCRSYRAIGQALRCNPSAPQVPCHRVIKSNGDIGGYKGESSGYQVTQKMQLLQQEGVSIIAGKVNLDQHFFRLKA